MQMRPCRMEEEIYSEFQTESVICNDGEKVVTCYDFLMRHALHFFNGAVVSNESLCNIGFLPSTMEAAVHKYDKI